VIIGKNGQVGQALQQSLAALGSSTCWGREELDLGDLAAIGPKIRTLRPTVIVNAAAYTAVDRAEQEPELAHRLNAQAPEQLAIAAQACGATLVHLSTDYVFNGEQSHPYQEDQATAPLGVYGKSKWLGEEAIRAHCGHHLILRTAWVYSATDKPNFVKTMVRLGREREEVRVVCDQIGSPTWARDIAQAIARLIPQLNDQTWGTYHFTNSGVASWYDFAVAIFEEYRQLGGTLQLDRVTPIPTEAYPTPAQRPAYSVLNCGKITPLLAAPPPHWRQSLRQMLQELNP
jgi:dTDP-4-dehydrorhamnose reductase